MNKLELATKWDDVYLDLYIFEWKLNLYRTFTDKIKVTEQDELLGYCKEKIGRDWYCEFERLQYEYQHDIARTLVAIKKQENDFISYE